MTKPLPTFEIRVPVPVPVLCCAFCGSEMPAMTRSENNGDATRTLWLKCSKEACGKPFKLVLQYEPAHFRAMEVVPGDRGTVTA